MRPVSAEVADAILAKTPGPPEPAPPHSTEKKRTKRADTPQGRSISFDDVEPSPGPVDGPGLFADISAVLLKYMVLPLHVSVTLSLWIAMTYLTDAVEVMPRLLLSSPTMACGKTRLFSLLGALVWRPVHMVGISPSAMFRLIEAGSPTLLMDEMDNARLDDNPDLRLLLNSGHTRTSAHTYRCANESLEVRRFSTWAPVALAAIGKLPDTVSSRCIRVAMRRRKADEKVERLRESRIRDELRPVCERLARWCQDHAEQVSQSDPDPPEGLSDRDSDSWAPLLAVAGAIGAEWPDKALAAAKALSGPESVSDEPAEVLADMRTVFGDLERISTEDALRALIALDERPWADWRHGRALTPRGLAGLLKPYQISSGTLAFGETKRKGYLRAWFEDAWTRYTPLKDDSIRSAVADRINSGPDAVFDPLPTPPRQRQENAVSTARHAVGNAATDRNPKQGGVDGNAGSETVLEPCRFCDGRVLVWGSTLVCQDCHGRQDGGEADQLSDRESVPVILPAGWALVDGQAVATGVTS